MENMVVWKDRANPIFIQLTQGGVALESDDIDLITKAELHYKGGYYSSTDYPDYFDLSTYKADGKIVIKPGLLPLTVGNDAAELIIYDATNTEGLFWMQIATQVRDDAAI